MKKSGGDSIVATRSLFQTGDGGSIPTSPHQLEAIEISPVLASDMNKEWHSRLPDIDWSCVTRNTHYVCYGAYYLGRWYAVAIWSSPVAQNRFKNGREILELRRFAISSSAPKNTASWMIGVMRRMISKKFPDIRRLVSYQDVDTHKGTIYKASGWARTSENRFADWNTNTRTRNAAQSTSDKVRWEFLL